MFEELSKKGKRMKNLLKILILIFFIVRSRSKKCELKDKLHSRSFSLNQLKGKYDLAVRKDMYLSLIEKITKKNFEHYCNEDQLKNIDMQTSDAFLIHQTNKEKKECVILEKSRIKLMKFQPKEGKMTIYFSENLKNGGEFAYKFIIKNMKRGGSVRAIMPILTFNSKNEGELYDKITYEIPYDSNGVEVEVKPFIFTSTSMNFFGLVSIPKLIFIILLTSAAFWFHLGMHEKHYPLHLVIISFSWLYLFIILASAIGIESTWINSAGLLLFIVAGVILLQFIKYETRKRLGYWLNFLILFEFFCETADISDNWMIVISLEVVVFVCLYGIGKVMLYMREEEKIPQGVDFNKEIMVTVLLAMKLVVYLARPIEPIRNPIYSVKLLGVKSTLPPTQETVEIFLVLGILLLCFFTSRMGVVFYRRRAKLVRGEDYGSRDSEDMFATKIIDDSLYEDTIHHDLDETFRRETDSDMLKI